MLFLAAIAALLLMRYPLILSFPTVAMMPSRPANCIVMAATGMRHDLIRVLSSIVSSTPQAFVVLLVKRSDADWLSSQVSPRSDLACTLQHGYVKPPLALHLRAYDWDVLVTRLPQRLQTRHVALLRTALVELVLSDLATAGAFSKDNPGAVLLDMSPNWARTRAPDGVLMCDSRDLVFQRDPFPEMWAAIAALPHNSSALTTVMPWPSPNPTRLPESPPCPYSEEPFPFRWDPRLAERPVLIVGVEAKGVPLGVEDINRQWLYCKSMMLHFACPCLSPRVLSEVGREQRFCNLSRLSVLVKLMWLCLLESFSGRVSLVL
jgi:hypothetical protein